MFLDFFFFFFAKTSKKSAKLEQILFKMNQSTKTIAKICKGYKFLGNISRKWITTSIQEVRRHMSTFWNTLKMISQETWQHISSKYFTWIWKLIKREMSDSLNKANTTTLRELFYMKYSSILCFHFLKIIFNGLLYAHMVIKILFLIKSIVTYLLFVCLLVSNFTHWNSHVF